MSSHLIVVDRISDWRWNREGLSIQDFDTYVFAGEARRKRPVRVINLCRRFGYLNAGYYCSLLAESRNDLPMPTVADIIDLEGNETRNIMGTPFDFTGTRMELQLPYLSDPTEMGQAPTRTGSLSDYIW